MRILPSVSRINSLPGAAGRKRLWPPTATDATGAFVVHDLPVGRYRLRLRAGAAEHELEAEVRAGERTALVLPSLDPRVRAAR